MQDLDLAKKRQKNEITDYDIIVEILHHERVELIDLSNENLDPDKLVSFYLDYSEFHGFGESYQVSNWQSLSLEIAWL